jgi:excisionase family DNA binding protein
MKTDELFTIEEVAGILKVDRRTIIRWICAGRLKAFKPAGSRFWRVRQRDLKKILK